MFSIEKTLEEMISFIRKFFYTVYFTFFHSTRLLRGEPVGEMLLKPSLYLLVWLFIHFGQLAVDYNIYNEKPSHALEDFGKFFEATTLENNILYILPMGAIIWLLTVLFKKLFFRSPLSQMCFKETVYYWLGNFLALVAFYGLIKFLAWVIVMNWHPLKVGSIDLPLKYVLLMCQYLPLLIMFLAVGINYHRLSKKRFWSFFIVFPLFVFCMSLFTKVVTEKMAKVLDIHKEPLSMMSVAGTDLLQMNGSLESPADFAYRWNIDVVVQNDDTKTVRIPAGVSLNMYSGDNEEPSNDMLNEIELSVDSFDAGTVKGLFVLKPHEYVTLHCHQMLNIYQIQEWKSYAKPDEINQDYFPFTMELTLNTPDGSPYVLAHLKVAFFVK